MPTLCLDVPEKILLRGNNSVPLTPKVFETRQALVENDGHLLEKDELRLKLRPDRFVEGSNLTEISPGGKSIAFAVGQSENQANEFGLVEINLETGAEWELTTEI